MLRIAAAGSLLATLLAVTPSARAQGDTARAEDLIRQANALRQKGQDVAALPLMRQAYEVARGPRTAAQLGLVELALGYWVDGDDHLTEALSPSKHPWIDRNRPVLEKARDEARSHVARLQIEGTPNGAEVRINGAAVGTFPLAGPVRVGEGHVTIDVRAPDRRPQSKSFDIAGGATQHYVFDLVAEPRSEPASGGGVIVGGPSIVESKPPPPPAGPPELPTWRQALPWGLAGAAVLAGGFGLWQHLAWRHSQSDFQAISACGVGEANYGSDNRCRGLYSDLTSHKTQAYVGYAVAGGMGIGAAVAFALNAAWTPADSRHAFVTGPTPLGLAYRGAF